jgi:hypothetical protein
MKSFIYIIILALLNNILGYSQNSSTNDKFNVLLDSCNLEFEIPDSFIVIPINENRDLIYQYAIKHVTKDYEIRYSIFPLFELLTMKNDTCVKMVDPNIIYNSLIIANIINLSGDPNINYQINYFRPEAVHDEFNADVGGCVVFPLNSEYGKDYKNCNMVFLHRDNIADVFISYLFNDYNKSEMDKIFLSTFYSLKFKK